ncbi:unnamed protein product [Rhizoctonia solani]|uniref:Uncharacterized protein n=1 Tax=Rhizoctonia solani TaxID=456999 RepID=A0A8H3C027_9AGAM|nr:unnamed protein product [Rhizoctonia solani]
MSSRTAVARALACRRAFSTVKNGSTKRCIPVATQLSKPLHTISMSRPSILKPRTPIVSQVRYYAASSEVEEDPERKGLYYHPVGNNVFALSFLNEKPSSQNSATVIGLVQGGEDSHSFQENRKLCIYLAALIEGVDQELGNDAVQRKEGWLHVHDYRNFPEMGRVGDPDDILGSVLVQDGKIKGETYQRMPSYRTCTTDGPVKLSPSLHERLLKSLREARQKESSS